MAVKSLFFIIERSFTYHWKADAKSFLMSGEPPLCDKNCGFKNDFREDKEKFLNFRGQFLADLADF